MELRFCDELGGDGFGWIVDEPMARASHALVADGKVWLVDPLAWPAAIDHARTLGEPAGVVQLLDRHNRDCGALAEQLGIPHVVAPDELSGSPFELVPIMRRKRWREVCWQPRGSATASSASPGWIPTRCARSNGSTWASTR